jgi:hypothetical protein
LSSIYDINSKTSKNTLMAYLSYFNNRNDYSQVN